MAVNYAALSALANGVNAFASVELARIEADGLRARGRFQERMFKENARLADIRAKNVLKKGDRTANKIFGQAQRVKGAQKAAFAGQNVRVNSGVARKLEQETDLVSAIDMQTARNNAWREAWGIQYQAVSMRNQGDLARVSGEIEAGSRIAAGNAQALRLGAKGVAQGVEALDREGVFGNAKPSQFEIDQDKRRAELVEPYLLQEYGVNQYRAAGWEDSSYYSLGDYKYDYDYNY